MKHAYRKIYWNVGQEITADTFIEADNYICSQQNLIRKLMTGQNYGLLPVTDNAKSSLSITADGDDAGFYINELTCYGITREGFLIEFENETWATERKFSLPKADSSSESFYIVLKINPFEEVLIEPVENEDTPFSHPVYELEIKRLNQIEGNELSILKIENNDAVLQIDENYIPPCMAIHSYEKLLKCLEMIRQTVTEIQEQLILKKNQYRKLIHQVSLLFFDLEAFSLSGSPHSLVQLIKKIIYTFSLFLTDIHFTNDTVLSMVYNHNDMAPIFRELLKSLLEIQLIIKENDKVPDEIEEDFTPQI